MVYCILLFDRSSQQYEGLMDLLQRLERDWGKKQYGFCHFRGYIRQHGNACHLR